MRRLATLRPRLAALRPAVAIRVDADGHSAAEKWRRWYATKEWRELRLSIFKRDRFTCQCGCGHVEGDLSLLVADHIADHQGDPALFWDEANLQTLWKPHHDGWKQALEARRRRAPATGVWGPNPYDPPSAHTGPTSTRRFFPMGENSEPTDLLGDALRPLPDKRGRRKLRFPVEVYERVELLVADGFRQDEIADAIGISEPTLRKYFRPELKSAVVRKRAEAVELLAAAARKGNVSAIKAWKAELDKQAAASAIRDRSARQPPARLGKKASQQAEAGRIAAGAGKYAPPPAPQLIVDNG